MTIAIHRFAQMAAVAAVAGLAVVGGSTASHAAEPDAKPNYDQTLINANYLHHPVDMKVTLADGTVLLNKDVQPGTGAYPSGNFDGVDHIDVIDGGKTVFSATFTYQCNQWQQCDWALLHVDHKDINYTWHTGNFGGFDFR